MCDDIVVDKEELAQRIKDAIRELRDQLYQARVVLDALTVKCNLIYSDYIDLTRVD
jgi:hypothetical protein